jgi:hypothetical protein
VKVVRVALHGFALFAANMAGLIVGILVFHALGGPTQLGIQVPLAVLGTVGFYLGWQVLSRNLPCSALALGGGSEHALAGLSSLVWAPLVFVPLHYFTQGYLTAAGNIVALGLFQLLANPVAIIAAWKAAPHTQHPEKSS